MIIIRLILPVFSVLTFSCTWFMKFDEEWEQNSRYRACLLYMKPWVLSPALHKKKKRRVVFFFFNLVLFLISSLNQGSSQSQRLSSIPTQHFCLLISVLQVIIVSLCAVDSVSYLLSVCQIRYHLEAEGELLIPDHLGIILIEGRSILQDLVAFPSLPLSLPPSLPLYLLPSLSPFLPSVLEVEPRTSQVLDQ